MNETFSQQSDEHDPMTEGLQRNGRYFTASIMDDPSRVDVTIHECLGEYSGYKGIELGPTFGYVRHPMGKDEMVWVGGILYWDPSRYEVHAETIEEGLDLKAMRKAYEEDGWDLQWTTPDRVIGLRKLKQ